jgi:hypothetical protein
MKSLALVGLLALVGCAAPVGAPPSASEATTNAAAVTDAAPFSWPIAAGWRSETIPFPLGFAPSITHRGTEELRFGPKFFDPTSPTYFTYAFAFVTEDKTPITAATLTSDLTTYFTGLMSAVTGAPSDPSLHSATITVQKDGSFKGVVHTIDGFGDKRPLALRLNASSFQCGDRQVMLAALSPSEDQAVLKQLEAVRASFTCGE